MSALVAIDMASFTGKVIVMKKSDIHKAFKEIGYKCTLRSHQLIEDGVELAFVSPCGYTNEGANVFGTETYEQHRSAFELCQKFRCTTLETGERVIV